MITYLARSVYCTKTRGLEIVFEQFVFMKLKLPIIHHLNIHVKKRKQSNRNKFSVAFFAEAFLLYFLSGIIT